MGVEQTSRETVEEIELAGNKDHDGSRHWHPRKGKQDREAARDQVAASDRVRNMLFYAHFILLLSKYKLHFRASTQSNRRLAPTSLQARPSQSFVNP